MRKRKSRWSLFVFIKTGSREICSYWHRDEIVFFFAAVCRIMWGRFTVSPAMSRWKAIFIPFLQFTSLSPVDLPVMTSLFDWVKIPSFVLLVGIGGLGVLRSSWSQWAALAWIHYLFNISGLLELISLYLVWNSFPIYSKWFDLISFMSAEERENKAGDCEYDW